MTAAAAEHCSGISGTKYQVRLLMQPGRLKDYKSYEIKKESRSQYYLHGYYKNITNNENHQENLSAFANTI
jgi:hypothetical protein